MDTQLENRTTGQMAMGALVMVLIIAAGVCLGGMCTAKFMR